MTKIGTSLSSVNKIFVGEWDLDNYLSGKNALIIGNSEYRVLAFTDCPSPNKISEANGYDESSIKKINAIKIGQSCTLEDGHVITRIK